MMWEVAKFAKEKLKTALPFIDHFGGLVTALVYNDQTEAGSVVKRFPIEYDVSVADALGAGNYKQFVPDNSNNRGIAYFEPLSQAFQGFHRDDEVWQSGIRLVCWYDKREVNMGEDTRRQLIALCNTTLCRKIHNDFPLLRIQFTPVSVLSDAGIFEKWSYDESVTQYLMHPFEYFAVDYNVRYHISSCADKFTVQASNQC